MYEIAKFSQNGSVCKVPLDHKSGSYSENGYVIATRFVQIHFVALPSQDT